MCGEATPSVPPENDSTTRSSSAAALSPVRSASKRNTLVTASSRVKSLRPPLPSVLPRTATTSRGRISP